MRAARIEAAIRTKRPEWSDRQVGAELAMAMNGASAFAVSSCSGASRAARRAFARRASAYDHVLVASASEPESGPEPLRVAGSRRARKRAFLARRA